MTLLVQNAVKKYEKGVSENFKQNPKAFWKYVKSKTRYQPPVSELATEDGKITSNIDKAELLNKTFAKVFKVEDPNDPIPNLENYPIEIPAEEINITIELIVNKIKLLNENKAWGPDDIHPKLLKECINQVKTPLYHIFSKSLATAELPLDWKKANVIPIFKKGNEHSPLKYRPISLTPIICKLMETIIRDSMIPARQQPCQSTSTWIRPTKVMYDSTVGML